MKSLALAAIVFYQRYLSPKKGFSCAYRVHTGHAGCSKLGYRAIRRYGVWRGIAVLNSRLNRCSVAYHRYSRPAFLRSSQAGFCDGGCDGGCDMPDLNCGSGKSLGKMCEFGDCCSNMGDCSWNRKKKRADDDTYIPPNNR